MCLIDKFIKYNDKLIKTEEKIEVNENEIKSKIKEMLNLDNNYKISVYFDKRTRITYIKIFSDNYSVEWRNDVHLNFIRNREFMVKNILIEDSSIDLNGVHILIFP